MTCGQFNLKEQGMSQEHDRIIPVTSDCPWSQRKSDFHSKEYATLFCSSSSPI